jgi:hypothetical protein
MNSISLESNSQSAEIDQKVSFDDREKIQHFVDFLLNKPKMLPDFLSILMDTISARAQQRGLTPETLDHLLINDKKKPFNPKQFFGISHLKNIDQQLEEMRNEWKR